MGSVAVDKPATAVRTQPARLARWRERASAVARFAADALVAPAALAACDKIGWLVRVKGGAPVIDNRGRIEIGSRSVLNSLYAPARLTTQPGGEIRIGDRAHFNFGCSISAEQRVSIGTNVSFGPYCSVSDAAATSPSGEALAAAPIVIGNGVWLANRVVVLPGARIGDGAVVTAGSVVVGEIPGGVIAGGIPARVLRRLTDAAPATTAESAPRAALAQSDDVDDAAMRAPPAAAAPSAVIAAAATLNALVIADFTVDDFATRLADDTATPRFAVEVAPFQQVIPSLLALAGSARDLVVVWTLPEQSAPAFRRLTAGEAIALPAILDEVDAFADLLAAALTATKCAVVPTWTLPAYQRGVGAVDLRPGGYAHALMAMNQRLIDRLAAQNNIFVLDAQRWIAQVGRTARPAKLWYMGKVAYSGDVFDEAVADIKAAYGAVTGLARKLIVVDLDDTMWGGIVGDAGWEALRLGGHDSLGEAFVDFQHALKTLKNRGILLAIASKNEEATALEAIRSHGEMVLREADFAAHRINWDDKARNVADIAAQLNLGLQSVVFLDDNPVERARVREMLPEVLVPEWPEDKHLYATTLLGLRCFDSGALSAEDLQRTEMMHAERKREAALPLGSLDDWIASLAMRLHVEPVSASTLARTVQLINKTNQLNLSTRRLTAAELTTWLDDARRELWVLTVSDRFGDSGLTGIVSLEADGDTGRIVDYVLSCRVMGRKVEEALVHVVAAAARRRGLARLEARLLPTAKNKPCLDFWLRSGFDRAGEHDFTWDLATPYPLHGALALDWGDQR